MRIIVADCSVIYEGRGSTFLGRAVRMIMVKDDGSVSVHNDKSNKPLNYMGGKVISSQGKDSAGNDVWFFEARNETIQVTIYDVVSDVNYGLTLDDPGLVRDGTEGHLQEWLADNVTSMGDDFIFVEREHRAGSGAVDLLCRDSKGLVAVEVKRTALLGVVYQTVRYVDAIREANPDVQVRGLIAALDIRPNTEKLALKKDLDMFIVPASWRKTHKLDHDTVVRDAVDENS